MTQKDLIIEYLKLVNDYVPAYKLRGLNTSIGFLGHQSDRRCRELYNSDKLDKRLNDQGCVEYKFKEFVPERVIELKVLNLI